MQYQVFMYIVQTYKSNTTSDYWLNIDGGYSIESVHLTEIWKTSVASWCVLLPPIFGLSKIVEKFFSCPEILDQKCNSWGWKPSFWETKFSGKI